MNDAMLRVLLNEIFWYFFFYFCIVCYLIYIFKDLIFFYIYEIFIYEILEVVVSFKVIVIFNIYGYIKIKRIKLF